MRITEHLMFAALMVPTFVLAVAAAVSLGTPEARAVTAQAAPALEHASETTPSN